MFPGAPASPKASASAPPQSSRDAAANASALAAVAQAKSVLPAAQMPPALAAVMPLADFVSKSCDHVKDYVKDQDFTEWTQIAFCTSGSADSEPANEFAKFAKTTHGTRAFGECRALFPKACYIEFGTPAPPGSAKNPTTPPPNTRQVALIDSRSPLEKGVDGKQICLENPHHTTDQGYCMTLEYTRDATMP